jgi:AraC family transcriptional activator of pobA
MEAKHKSVPDPVPAVDFYGDTSSWPMSELVHSERLVERSSLHGWRIRPHRHDDLTQLFLVLKGSGRARLDSVWHAVEAPCLLIIPERSVHEFEWAEASDGFVLSIRSSLVTALAQRIESLGPVFADAAMLDASESQQFLSELFAAIHDESVGQRSLKDVALDSLLRILAIWLARNSAMQATATAPASRAGKHYARFSRLVDKQHKLQWSVADYASALGITPSHLNAVCQQLVSRSALEVIHERLILAARRELAYTERNIAGVAHHLGFADPSYFTRFFKRQTGMTPGEYRRRSGTFDETGKSYRQKRSPSSATA